jgi:hypothetical protein
MGNGEGANRETGNGQTEGQGRGKQRDREGANRGTGKGQTERRGRGKQTEVGTHNFFFESAIAIPQLKGSTSAIPIPQLFKKCFSATATPQSQFFLKSATSSPQLESFTSTILGIFFTVE